MHRIKVLVFCILLMWMVPICRTAKAKAAWKAGVAKVVITPTTPMWMAGYASRNHPAEGKLTDLWCKVLALECASGSRAVFITLDLIGIDRALAQSICSQLAAQHHLARDKIAICTSHTHTGPVVGMNLPTLHYLTLNKEQQLLVDQYLVQLEKNVASAVDEAVQHLAPAKLTWGSGICGFATNRRNNSEEQISHLRARGLLTGPVDHDVPVLAARSENEELMAVVFGYACHSTVLSSYQWSGDYPGFAQIEIEKKHPGCVALFWAGCGADQNPLPRRSVELARNYGARLATSVDETLVGVMQPLKSELTTAYAEVDLPLGTLPTREEIEADTTSRNKYVAARAKMLLEQIDSGQPLSPVYPYPIQTWTLGNELQFIFLGGEVVVDYAVRLKIELNGRKTWVAAYANDVMAYIPSRRVLLEGGYEGGGSMPYYGLPTTWSPDLERSIVDEVHRQLQ